jgi:hypothetical protein
VVGVLVKAEEVGRAKRLVVLTGMVVGALKSARAEAVHALGCVRPRHRGCSSSGGEGAPHHHHDLLGAPYNPIAASCCVASLFLALGRVAQVCQQPELEARTLSVMARCGGCCCAPPRTILLPMLEIVSRNDFKLSGLALSLLEKVGI